MHPDLASRQIFTFTLYMFYAVLIFHEPSENIILKVLIILHLVFISHNALYECKFLYFYEASDLCKLKTNSL